MTEKKSIFQRAFLIVADMYGLYISLLLIIWLFTGEEFFFTNIFVSTMPSIFYGIPIILFIALWQRSLRTILFLILPVLGFIILYSTRFLPRDVPQANGIELSLLTYNLRASNTNTSELDSILIEADADIVTLQEVSFEIGEWVETAWTDEYPYQIRFTIEDETPDYTGALPLLASDISQYAGRMTLSRYPIEDYDIVPSSIKTTLYVRSEININGRIISIYNVHLPPPLPINIFSTEVRHDGLVEILEVTRANEDVILMGDFNMTDQSEDYHLVTKQYTDVFTTTSSGLGTTWANGNNLSSALFFMPSFIRIDYMFVGDAITPQYAQVIREGVSDHYPLYTTVILE